MIYVMSDIHGNRKAFDSILNQINLKEDDELYILGDIVDRQDYGIELLQHVIKMENVHMLLGNHEYMMMDALGFPYEMEGGETDYMSTNEKIKLWFANGGDVTYRSWMKLSNEEQEEVKQYLLNLPISYDVNIDNKTFKLVHAAPPELYDIYNEKYPGMINSSKAFFSVWERDIIRSMKNNNKYTTVIGHTPVVYFTDIMPMEIYKEGSVIAIDCGAAYQNDPEDNIGYRLSCLRLDDMTEFYSN